MSSDNFNTMFHPPHAVSTANILMKAASFVLAVILFLSPIHQILAQSEQAEVDRNAIAAESVITERVAPQQASPDQTDLSSQSLVLGSVIETSAGYAYIYDAGSNSQSPSVNAVTGSFQYDYPIVLPPGRNGMTPNLTLRYDSNNTDGQSAFGYGWDIALPKISRMNKTGIQNLYSDDYFESSWDGELVSVSSTTYRAKTERGGFRTYDFENNNWVVIEKDGTKHLLGSTTQARMYDPDDSAKISDWYIERDVDTNGNYIDYEYTRLGNKLYPELVTYTGYGSDEGLFRVEFSLENRPDEIVSYASGYKASSSKRVSQILVEVNNVWMTKYQLSYTTGHNSNRSLLDAVTLSGRNDALQTVTYPDTEFTYEEYTGSDKGWTEDASWDTPEYFIEDVENFDSGMRQIDINGDGLIDLPRFDNARLYASSTGITPDQEIYINTGTGFATTSEWTLPQPIEDRMAFVGHEPNNDKRIDLGARFADVNGDGYSDIVWGFFANTQGEPLLYELSVHDVFFNDRNGGWSTSSDYFLPSGMGGFATVQSNGIGSNGVVIADINGDGLPDLARNESFTYASPVEDTYFNTGNGWQQASSTWHLPEPVIENELDMGTRILDVNGDGLVDVVRNYYDEIGSDTVNKTYLNTGNGWELAPDSWDAPIPFAGNYYNSNYVHSTRFVDINGDGLVDVFENNENTGTATTTIYINTGEGWVDKSNEWGDTLTIFYDPYGSVDKADAGVRFFDIDGDNMVDMVKAGPDTDYPNYNQKETYIHNGSVPDKLTSVNLPEGGVIDVDYTQSVHMETSGGERLNPELPMNLNVVGTTTYDSSFGVDQVTTYSYENGSYYYASSTQRQFAGFGLVKELNDDSITESRYHQGNGGTGDEPTDSYAKIGSLYDQTVTNLAGDVYQKTRTNYSDTSLGNGASSTLAESQVSLSYDGDSDHKDTAVAYSYDSYGNVTAETQYGEVTASTSGSYTDTGSDKRTIERSYTNDTSSYIVGLPTNETVKNNSGTKVAESVMMYDSNGNPTEKAGWISGSNYATTSYAYNSYGLVTSEVNPLNSTTTYTYDSHNLYPATTTNALNQSTVITYDYTSGQPLTITDPNGNQTIYTYDGLDRVLTESIPDPTSGSPVTKTTYTYTDTSGAKSVTITNYRDGSNSQVAYQYFDGFGRLIQSRREAETSNQYVVSDIAYNSSGQVEKETLPYFGTGTSRTTATTDNDLYTEYAYDPLERVMSATTTVGTTNTSYDQWTETVTDPLGNDKSFDYDAFGRLVGVDENNGTSTYNTAYTWDESDNLTKITDALGNVRNIEYDGLSRRTSLEDLHDTSDTSYGTWLFAYDAASNLSSTTNPNGQAINYTYDYINRILTENYLGQSGTEVVYTYDTCTEGVGMICSVANQSATTTYTYTPNGLVESETKTISGTGYTTDYEYDRQGNQTLVTYPDNSEVRYTYNDASLLEQVEQRESGGTFADIISNFDYGPHGLVTEQVYGNGATTTKTYDADELYRLRSIATVAASSAGTGGAGEEHALIEAELTFAQTVPEETTTTDTSTAEEPEPEPEPAEPTATEPAPVEENSNPTSVEQSMVTSEPQTEEVVIVSYDVSPTLDEVVVANDIQSTQAIDPAPYTETSSKYVIKDGRTDLQDDEMTVELNKTKPKVNFKKWNNEVNVGVAYNSVSNVAEMENGSDKVKWKDIEQEVHAYPLGSSDLLPNGGFEIEIQLNEKPKSNKFTFALDGYENLDFFYQPPLSDEVVEGETCTETECISDETGEVVRTRAENVVGSYAVYHKDKQGQFENETNYGSGKAFHIYRPHIVDDEGSDVWGELSIEEGELVVTVSQSFLAQATYPVMVDPTFGYTSVGGSTQTVVSQDFRGSLFTTPSDYGSFDSFSVYCDATASAYNAKAMVIVHSSLNIATNGVSSPITCTNGSAAWHTPTYSSSPSMSASTEYILGLLSDSSRVRMYYDSGTTNQGHEDNSNDYDTPENLGSAYHDNNKYSVYITYTASGGGGNATPTAPTLLEAEGQTNPTNITDSTPEFTAIYNDLDSSDSAVNYQIQVDDNSDFSSTYWDSGKTSLATTTQGNRTGDITYGGSTLASSTTYYWRIKFWDDDDAEGLWSTSTATFSLAAAPSNNAPTAPTSLETEGQTNPTNITDSTPEFSAIYNDPDTGDSAVYYQIQVDDNSDFSSTYWDSTKTALSSVTEGNRTSDITYGGSALASSTTYYWRIKLWDDDDAEGAWSSVTATFSLAAGGGGPTNATPTAPTLLETEGQTNPTSITDSTPEFTAIYNDEDAGDVAVYYQIQVATSTSFITNVWDSTKSTLATTTAGNRTSDITYSGTSLASSTTYYWRIKFWDEDDYEGDWSTSTASFSLAAATPPSPSYSGIIQHLTYTYDAVGNITQIVDASDTDSSATTTYGYDDLYRLTSAATSQASTTPYSRTYTYNAIGNILTKSDQTGTYSYTGDTGTNYANPHAVTSIGSAGYTYDHNGNLLSVDSGPQNTWTYNNRLLTSAVSSATSTYGYDHTGARVMKAVSTGTGGGSGGLEFSDSYTEGTDTNLDSHTPETGGGYTKLITVGGCDIAVDAGNDTFYASGATSCSSSDGVLYRTNSQATHADVELEVTATKPDGADDTNILACRIQDVNNMYAVQFNEDSSQLYKRVSGTWTQLDTTNSQIADNSVVTLTCDGSSITFEDDGVEILGATDISITSAGYGGIGMGAVIVSGNDVSIQEMDDFTMTTLSGSGGVGPEANTTYYPFSNYEVTDTGTTTKHVYAGDMLVATIEGSGGGALTYFNHLDHLNSTNVVTDGIGYITQELSYYPFGDTRIDNQYGPNKASRTYIGEIHDDETDLSYFNARYYANNRGQFTSQDPVFLAMGNGAEIKARTGFDMLAVLSDPQQLNSYAYARNNPIRYKDPTGNLSWEALLNNPGQSLRHAFGWGAFSLLGNTTNRPFAASLLRHSASLSPSPVLNIDSSNQGQYGNPIDQIMQTDQYKSYINQTIERAQNGKMTNSGLFEFEGRSDLYYALHGANIESQVTRENGEWVVNSTVSDRYDFNPVNPETYKGSLTRIPAGQAYKDQDSGVLSNYDVKIKVNDRIKE